MADLCFCLYSKQNDGVIPGGVQHLLQTGFLNFLIPVLQLQYLALNEDKRHFCLSSGCPSCSTVQHSLDPGTLVGQRAEPLGLWEEEGGTCVDAPA